MHLQAGDIRLVHHVALLLSGDRSAADRATVGALARVADRSDPVSDALARIARTSRRAGTLGSSTGGSLEMYDVAPEQRAGAAETLPPAVAIRAALDALTDRERSIVVLRSAAGWDLPRIARAIRRPIFLVRREHDAAAGFLAEVGGAPPDQAVSILAEALSVEAGPHCDAAALADQIDAAAADEAPRHRMALLAGASGVLVVGLVAGALVLGVDRAAPPATEPPDESADAPADPEPTPSGPLDLPDSPSGLKLVGFERVMLAVPEDWSQRTTFCTDIPTAGVLYPAGPELAPCEPAGTRGASVSFERAHLLADVVLDGRAGSVAGSPVRISAPTRRGGAFVQYAAVEAMDVAVVVRSPDRRLLMSVIDSLQEVPRAYVVVPNCLRLDPDEAVNALSDQALNGRIFADSSDAGELPEHVVRQSPSVGTVVPFDSTVNLGVVPK